MEIEKLINELVECIEYSLGIGSDYAYPELDLLQLTVRALKQQNNDIHHMKLIIDEYEKTLKKAGLI